MMTKKKIISSILLLLAAVCPGIIFLMIPRILIHYPSVSEAYAMQVFPWISRPATFISSLIPISLTEVFVLFSAGSAVLWITWFVVRLVRSEHRKRLLYRMVLSLFIMFSLASASFILMHGINYTRLPLEKSLSLDASRWSEEELTEVTLWLEQQMNDTRSVLPEDENGCMLLHTSIAQSLSDAYEGLDRAGEVFPELSGSRVSAKPVALSHYWSYTGIAGMYFPFFGEANVNIDIPAIELPLTMCHEVSHTRGIAREQDANLASFLACIYSDRTDFQYSGYQYAFSYCMADLHFADIDAYQNIITKISDAVFRDWQQEGAYWLQFEGPVEQTSTEINDSYLKANQQEEGVRSYTLVTNLIIDYYFSYVKGK
jgi:hypothetical protein